MVEFMDVLDVCHKEEQVEHYEKPHIYEKNYVLGENDMNMLFRKEKHVKPSGKKERTKIPIQK